MLAEQPPGLHGQSHLCTASAARVCQASDCRKWHMECVCVKNSV